MRTSATETFGDWTKSPITALMFYTEPRGAEFWFSLRPLELQQAKSLLCICPHRPRTTFQVYFSYVRSAPNGDMDGYLFTNLYSVMHRNLSIFNNCTHVIFTQIIHTLIYFELTELSIIIISTIT